MRLRALRVHDVRRFAGRGVAIEDIGDGVSCLIRDNGFGKSTLLEALETLLFVKHGSRAERVEALRPHAGGAPVVSADLAFADGLFRIEKRFLARPFARVTALPGGRLVAQADQAQDWLAARLAPKREQTALPLLWVRQGASGDFAAAQDACRRTLDDVARDEAAALTGGDRLAALLRRTRDEKETLLTRATAKPLKDGPLGRALAAVEALEAEAGVAAAARRETERAVEELRATLAELRGWADPQAAAEDAAALKAAREALEAARQAADRRALAASDLRLAEMDRADAAAALARFDATLAALETAGRAAQAAAEAAEARRETAEAARARFAEARAATAQAAARSEAATAAEAEGRAQAAAAASQARRAALEARRDAAAEAARERAAALAEAAALTLAPGALAEAERLEAQLRAAQARRDAGRAVARVDYAAPDAARLMLDGRALADGESVGLDGPTRFEIPGIGRLTVDPGPSAAETAAAVAAAADALRAHLAPMGCASVAALRARIETRADHQRRAEAAGERLRLHAPAGPEALEAELAALPAPPAAEAAPPPDAAALEADSAAARRAEAALRAAETEAAAAAGAEDAALAAALAAKAAAASALAGAAAAAPPQAERDPARDALARRVAAAASAEAARRAALAALDAAPAPSVAFAEAERARRETAARQRETQVARLSERAANLRAAIQGRAGTEERLADTEARLARAREDLARWRAKADALLRLEAALEAADAALRARVHAPLRAELAPLLRLVMAAPAELVLDDATLAPAGLARDGVTTAREALSGGEQEQAAILTRLAFAALMARGGEAPAVILDDALAHSDDARLDRMFAAIGSLADRLQILVLSCHRRAFAALGGALLEPVPWRPDPD